MIPDPSDRARLETFAEGLRDLRLRAGKPSYQQLTTRTQFGRTALSEALNGNRIPTWDVTRALVTALGGNETEWKQRWAELAGAQPSPRTATPSPPADPTHPDAGPPRTGRQDTTPPTGPSASGSAGGRPEDPTAGTGPVTAEPAGQRSRPVRRRGPVVAAAVLVGALAAVALWVGARSGGPDPEDARPAARPDLVATCRVVTARDITVFTSARGEESWTSWPTGTRFWAEPDAGPGGRLRTPLRNGRQGWVTAEERYVRPATGCP